jgi:DNA ligase-1
MPRIQPETIIQQLEADNSRLVKEQILAEAMSADIPEFFEGLQMALSPFVTFGVKAIEGKSESGGQGLSWENFKQLAVALQNRSLTGNEARSAIKLAMNIATQDQWNRWYKLILQKDLRCGVSEKTVNTVAKKSKKPQYAVPVFNCMLAQDSANHEAKLTGAKILQPKLDGVRAITVIDYEAKTVTMYTRNGKVLENFGHITDYLEGFMEEFGRSYILDGEVVSRSFQDLMKQVHRKDNVKALDARLCLFDIVPLVEFKAGKSVMAQKRRSAFLKNFENIFNDSGFIEIIPQIEVNLDEFMGEIEYKDYNKKAVEEGFEGIMIKDPNSLYECKRTVSWMKSKPFIEVSLTVTAVE